jgi:hypothetical protein
MELMMLLFCNCRRPGHALPEVGRPYQPGQQIHTGDPAWDHYNAAQKVWQKEVQDLLARRRPDLAGVSQATLRMQWALLDLRAARIRYLLASDPQRFVRDQDLAHFIRFEWTPQDTAALRARDPSFAPLEAQIDRLQEEALSHEQYPAAREFLQELLFDPEFREDLARFVQAGQEVEELLANHGKERDNSSPGPGDAPGGL